MQALRLIVPGSYRDSQIYQGRLYLFSMDRSLFVLDWDETIEEYGSRTGEPFALSCAFQRSDYLYGSRWDLFFADRDVIALINSKFDTLASKPLTLDSHQIDKYRQSNHLHVLYDDRLEVWSFNHDYLVDQEKKRLGTAFESAAPTTLRFIPPLPPHPAP